jgi:hypothetical protein
MAAAAADGAESEVICVAETDPHDRAYGSVGCSAGSASDCRGQEVVTGLGIAEGGGRGPAPDKLAFLRPASHELIATGIVVSDEDDLVDIDPE